MKKKNEYLLWLGAESTIVLPFGYHWDVGTQRIVKNDLTWNGSILEFYHYQQSPEYNK